MSYTEKYKFYYKNKNFSFILKDLSIIGFEDGDTGFFYFQSPYSNSVNLYNEYCKNQCFYQISDLLTDELEEREHPFYARYDYSEGQYAEGSHPVAHMHLGVDTEIRIASERKLKPMSFVLFILRQFYPNEWIVFLTLASLRSHRETALKSVRQNLVKVDSSYRKTGDFFEMYFV